MKRRLCLLAGVMSVLTASLGAAMVVLTASLATAATAPAPSWNAGYGWWPGGYGFAPLTVHARNYPCSVTVYGPTFTTPSSGWSQKYGGGTSCVYGLGRKKLTISDQVLGQSGHTWYTIKGSKFTTRPTDGSPVRMIRTLPATLGHAYRAVAAATLVVPNGHAGCSITNTCSQTITVTATSRPLAP